MRRLDLLVPLLVACVLSPLAVAQTAPGEIPGHRIPMPGAKVEGTTARLSEVEAEMVARLAPQEQAERLLQYAISHHIGATEEIKLRVRGWRGVIKYTPSMATLLEVARNGDDLRVRAAAIEVELSAFDVAKAVAQVDALLATINADPPLARHQIYVLGLLANRGIDSDRIHEALRTLARSEDEMVRFQSYAAIANIGTDATVNDLMRAFHHDPSPNVRINGGGCGLAHCGMLTRAQRMQAVPGLLAMVQDETLGPLDISYAYRALREITDESLPDDAAQWRAWYAQHGAETTERFRKFADRNETN